MKVLIIINFQILFCATQFINDEDTTIIFPDWEIFYRPLDTLICKNLTTINNCTCRECPGNGAVCFGEECKYFPTDINVVLTFFKLQLSSVAVIRKDDLRNLSNLIALEIEGNLKLHKIEEGTFRNMILLRNLTFTSNGKLTYLEERVFEGLLKLEILCISKNGFVRISDITKACSPNYVPKLKLLSLSESSFHEVHFDDFYPMNGSHLEQLNLILCQIENIHPDSLKPLLYLRRIRLCQNVLSVTILTKFIIRTLEIGIQLDRLNLYQIGLRNTSPYELLEALGNSSFTEISLGANNINIIDDDWFPYMRNLTHLDMRFCSTVEITNNAFRPLINLQRLLLKGNRLTSIPTAVTVPKRLFFLDISGNVNDDQSGTYFYIQQNIFNMTNMSYLHISYNNIGSISKSTFIGLTTIVKLNLKNAYISYIESGSFAHMKQLLYLELTNNPLLGPFSLTADTFLGLNNLRVLLLGGCSLQNLTSSPSIFTHVSNLTHLGLDRNNLRTILPNQLTHLNLLSELQVSDNKLPSWNNRILPSSNLSLLNLSQNKFINITVAMLEDWRSVQFLYLQDNPFWCDCTLKTVAIWIEHNQMALVRKSTDEDFVAQCIAPEEWRGKSVSDYITYLYLNSNDECEDKLHLAEVIAGSVLLAVVVVLMLLGYWYRWHVRYWLFLWRLSFAKHTRSTGPSSDLAYEYDAFVSYSVEDRAWVAMMVEALEPTLRLCVFERDFPAGAAISQAALRAVVASRRTLLVLSEAFARSRWCRWEAQLAQFHQLFFRADSAQGPDDTLLLVRLQPVRRHVTPTLHYLMKTRIYLDWPEDPSKQQEFWEKLKTSLSAPKGKGS